MTSYTQNSFYSSNAPSSGMHFTPINRDRESYQSFGSMGSRRRVKEVRYDETPGRFRRGPHFAEGISVNVNNHNSYNDESKYSIGSAVTSRASYQLDTGLPSVKAQKPCKITFKMESNGRNSVINSDHVIDTKKEYETFSEKTFQDSFSEGILIHHKNGKNGSSGASNSWITQSGGGHSGFVQSGGGYSGLVQGGGGYSGLVQSGGGYSGLVQSGGGHSGFVQSGGGYSGLVQGGGGHSGFVQSGGGYSGLVQSGGGYGGGVESGGNFTTSQVVYNTGNSVIQVPNSDEKHYSSSKALHESSTIENGLSTEMFTEITKSPEWRIMRQSRTDEEGEKIYYELKQVKNEKGEWENVEVLPGDTTNMATSSSEWAKWSTTKVDPITGSTRTDPMPTISGEYWIQRKKDNTWKRVRYQWEHDPNGQWKKVNSDTGKVITTQGNWKNGTAWELDKNAVPRKVNYEWVMDNNGQWCMEKKGRKNRPVDTTWQEGTEWVTKDSNTTMVNYRWVQDKSGKWLKLNQETGDILETAPKGKGLNITKSDVQYYYHADKGKLIKNITNQKFQDGKLRSKKVYQEDIPKEEADFMLKQAAMRQPPELLSGRSKKTKRHSKKYDHDSLGDVKTLETRSNQFNQISSNNSVLQTTREQLLQ